MRALRQLLAGLLAFLCLVCAATAQVDASEARVIIKLRDSASALRANALPDRATRAEVARIAQRRASLFDRQAGMALTAGRVLGPRTQVVKARGADAESLARRLAAHPDVAWAQVDRRRHFHHLPSDPLFLSGGSQGPAAGQWYLRAGTAAIRSGINAEGAWDLVRGSSILVVAVLDTGVLPDHPDLAAMLVPGYDMIAISSVANDGSGRDGDAADPGDWVTSADTAGNTFRDCDVTDSSWHGSLVAGLIGGVADNGIGMAGTAFGVRVQPVRVLGKCGGYDSDIIAGMLWAGGLEVPGLPANDTPARVINLSLGGTGSCDSAYREAVQSLTAAQVVVVAAAGNSVGHAVGTPANCPGVIGVAGLRHAGSKVGFSDIGPEITISAPGGNCVNIGAGQPCLYPILSSLNTGIRGPLASGNTWSDSTNFSVGTSFAAPLVAGTVALMLSARPDLTQAQVVEALKRAARPFPTTGADNGPDDPTPVPACRAPDGTNQLQCYCNTILCGAGMLDAHAAVQVVQSAVSRDESARQLMNFGESAFPHFFPDRLPTQGVGVWKFRYYPTTGAYLGVVVQPNPEFILDGVYVMGGPFGPGPLYVGQLQSFITPAGALASPASARKVTAAVR